MQVKPPVLRPRRGQWSLLVSAWVREASTAGPARSGLRAEHGHTRDLRWLRMADLPHVVSELEVIARPRQGHAHQVGVVADEGVLLVVERHDNALHRDIVSW